MARNGDVSTVGLLLSLLFIFGVNCRGIFVDRAVARRALETQGYSDVQILRRHEAFMGCQGCSGHDAARFDAHARNPAGKRVSLYVCVGWPFKGATVRSE